MSAEAADWLTEAVGSAYAEGRPLRILGSGSKVSHSKASHPVPEVLPAGDCAGVVDYQPDELVLTARCGSPLRDISALLDQHRQQLPFEPPMIGGAGTLGGAAATGWSGPGRPWRGSVRDAVLGVEMINGLGQRLKFGGQVMKNVAGYDLSRLQVGAWGTLGVLLSISVRLSPQPETERTCQLQCDARQGLAWMRKWARVFSPISATCHEGDVLSVRLSGPQTAVAAAAARIGGDAAADLSLWRALRDRALGFFRARPGPSFRLWRIDCAPAAALPSGLCLIEWSGARRWWWTDLAPAAVRAHAAAAHGFAVVAQGQCSSSGKLGAPPAVAGRAAPRPGEAQPGGVGRTADAHPWGRRAKAGDGDAQTALFARLKAAFDPKGVLNPHLSDANGIR